MNAYEFVYHAGNYEDYAKLRTRQYIKEVSQYWNGLEGKLLPYN